MEKDKISIADIFAASNVLRNVTRVTEIIAAPNITDQTDLYLKPENMQITGSFKMRGAYYKMSKLTQEDFDRGIVTCSAGNHAQGVAFAAQQHGISAKIFLPESVPMTKLQAIRNFRAQTILVKGEFDDAKAECLHYVETHNAIYIPPFDDYDVIAGQGTVGWEIMDQLPEVDAVVVPVGGGGLISGVALAVKTLNPNCKVYGVQTIGSVGALSVFAGGNASEIKTKKTIADGIAVHVPGQLTMEICNKYVDDMVCVHESQIRDALIALISKYHIVVEGAGAVAVAAVMFNLFPLKNKKTVCILSGGNIDSQVLSNLIIDQFVSHQKFEPMITS